MYVIIFRHTLKLDDFNDWNEYGHSNRITFVLLKYHATTFHCLAFTHFSVHPNLLAKDKNVFNIDESKYLRKRIKKHGNERLQVSENTYACTRSHLSSEMKRKPNIRRKIWGCRGNIFSPIMKRFFNKRWISKSVKLLSLTNIWIDNDQPESRHIYNDSEGSLVARNQGKLSIFGIIRLYVLCAAKIRFSKEYNKYRRKKNSFKKGNYIIVYNMTRLL